MGLFSILPAMKKLSIILASCLLAFGSLQAAPSPYWWGASVGLGANQPYRTQSSFDLHTQDENNQLVPLFLSSDGSYMWSDSVFVFSAENGEISTSYPLTVVKAGNTLRDAYLTAQAKYFPASGQLPDTLFFTMPQPQLSFKLIA